MFRGCSDSICKKQTIFFFEQQAEPSDLKSKFNTSIWEINSLPTINRPIQSKCKKLSASIITGIPIKDQLEE